MKLLLRKYSPDFPIKSGEVRISSSATKIKRRKAVKITSANGSIIRELVKTNFKEDKLFIDMDYDSRVELGVTEFYGRDVDLKIKQVFKPRLYWSHPDHGLRLGFQLGVIGLVLGIISLVVTFYPIISSSPKAGEPITPHQTIKTMIDTTREGS